MGIDKPGGLMAPVEMLIAARKRLAPASLKDVAIHGRGVAQYVMDIGDVVVDQTG